MKLMITGDKLRIEKVSERKDEPSARDWLSDKARRQRRDASGRFAGGKPRKTGGFARFFVLAKPM